MRAPGALVWLPLAVTVILPHRDAVVMLPKVVPVLGPCTAHALVGQSHVVGRGLRFASSLWKEPMPDPVIRCPSNRAHLWVAEPLHEDALLQRNSLDLVLVKAHALDDTPQVRDDIPLLTDDLIAHCHLELQLLEPDCLHPKGGENLEKRRAAVLVHCCIDPFLNTSALRLVCFDVSSVPQACVFVVGNICLHGRYPLLDLHGLHLRWLARLQIVLQVLQLTLVADIRVFKLEQGLLKVDALLRVLVDLRAQVVEPLHLCGFLILLLGCLYGTAFLFWDRWQPIRVGALLLRELSLELLHLVLQVIDDTLVVADMAFH
mmetsp:Transcript_28448/g.67726  ORF Transcript_28448/g.67726 Transcript_28448/m.67726 type:complete len:318 (+) Transcript_28448:869-1822(+)